MESEFNNQLSNIIDIFEAVVEPSYKTAPEGYTFSSEFPSYIIAFCPDTESWFVTNNRFFYYEYPENFDTEESGIHYFCNNVDKFYDLQVELMKNICAHNTKSLYLENTGTTIRVI